MCKCYQSVVSDGRKLIGIIPDEQCFNGQTYLTGLSVKQTKDGKGKNPLMMNFCPFCGEKFKRLTTELISEIALKAKHPEC
jgi:hypothetical protein